MLAGGRLCGTVGLVPLSVGPGFFAFPSSASFLPVFGNFFSALDSGFLPFASFAGPFPASPLFLLARSFLPTFRAAPFSGDPPLPGGPTACVPDFGDMADPGVFVAPVVFVLPGLILPPSVLVPPGGLLEPVVVVPPIVLRPPGFLVLPVVVDLGGIDVMVGPPEILDLRLPGGPL